MLRASHSFRACELQLSHVWGVDRPGHYKALIRIIMYLVQAQPILSAHNIFLPVHSAVPFLLAYRNSTASFRSLLHNFTLLLREFLLLSNSNLSVLCI